MLFSCPVHKVKLDERLFCSQCGVVYPSINGVPILLNDKNSVFQVSDYTDSAVAYEGASGYAGHLDRRTGLRNIYRMLMHYISESRPVGGDFNSKDAIDLINQDMPNALILVIGAGDTSYTGNIMYTDVAFGSKVNCIADAHDLPFEDLTFDACVAVAVLEHVADPQRCVAEIQRVLKPQGFIFSETPFLQPVHMGAHDFTRFTFIGHRRLFRYFDEIQSGIAGGPAASAAKIMCGLLVALTDRPFLKKLLRMLGLLLAYPLRMLDHLTKRKSTAYDSAAGFYFFGRLRSAPISDRAMINYYNERR